MKQDGFSLFELLVVIALVAVLTVISVASFSNAKEKARDAERKSDLNRIKIAFEDYFNDKGYYPISDLVISLNNKSNCESKTVFAPYLVPWPCDPIGNPYKILVNTNRFMIGTMLEYKSDKDIKTGFTEYNYGVSSSNILWYKWN